MATQQPVDGIEHQNAVQVIRVDTKGEASSSLSGTQPQPLSVDQQFIEIDERLYDAFRMIGTSRTKLYDYRVLLATYEHRYKEEQQHRLQCARAYKGLHAQHERAITDLSAKGNKILSLQQELEGTKDTIRAYESKIKEYERRLGGKAISGDNKDHNMTEVDWDAIEHAIAKKEELEARNRKLENEKFEMMREHQNEKCKMVQEHQNALINAANRISAAEQRIKELEVRSTPECQELASIGPTASPEPIRSPSVEKRPLEENSQQQDVPAKRGRKGRKAAKPWVGM